jgi:hypothetical protein
MALARMPEDTARGRQACRESESVDTDSRDLRLDNTVKEARGGILRENFFAPRNRPQRRDQACEKRCERRMS